MKKKSRKIGLALFFTILLLSLATVIVVFALEYTDKDTEIKWSFTPLSEKITIDGKEYPTAQIDSVTLKNQTTEFVIPTTVTSETGTVYYVTKIKANAFKDNKKVFGQLTLPEHLSYIGDYAFSGTYIYGTVRIPKTVKDTFDENGKIATYGIGKYAFNNCVGIKEVVLSSGITHLHEYAFANCFALSKINTEKVTVFGKGCFEKCHALIDITISNKTIAIKENAFNECSSLNGIIDLSFIGKNGNLKSDDKYGTKPALDNNAFLNCVRIEGFIIPDKNSFVNFSAFKGCNSLQGYYAKNNPEYYAFEDGEEADGILYTKNMVKDENGQDVWDGTLTLHTYPATRDDKIVTINDKVTAIKANAFSGASNVEEIVIGSGMTVIGQEAFAGSSIKFIFIPDNIHTVGFSAFKNCTKLETVIMGTGVSLVAADAFNGATSIKLVIAGNDMVSPIATSGTFYHSSEYHCNDHIYGYSDVPPTCEENGYYKCVACHRYEYVKAKGHTGAIIETGDVTCDKDGYIIVECIDCNDQQFKVITEKALGHVSNGTYFTVEAGYMKPSFTYSVCSVCNLMFVDKYDTNFNLFGDVNCNSKVDYYDYSIMEKYIADNSSVTEFSRANADINRDGNVDKTDLDILFSFLSGKIDSLPNELSFVCENHTRRKDTLELIVASCETPGFRIRYCHSCGYLTDEINSAQLKHVLSDSQIVQPTCSREGKKIFNCTNCNKQIQETIEKLPHTHNWYATASSRGFEYSTCSVCGEFEYRQVDYSELEGLFSTVQMKCTCSTTCKNLLNEKIKTHVNSAYYSTDYAIELKKFADKFLTAMNQSDVDDTAEDLTELLSNVKYKVTGVPSVFLSTAPSSQSDGYQPTSILIAGKDEEGNTWLEAYDQNSTAKVRGRGSATHSKKSYNIKFSTEVDLFGMGKSKKYCLIANQNDPTLIKNALTFELSHLFGIDYSCNYEIVDLYVNGEHKGSYVLSTAIEVGEDRIDIDEEFDYLLEIEHSPLAKDLEDCVCVDSPIYKIQFLVNEPEIKDFSAESLSNMYTIVMEIDFAIQSGDWNRINKYVDVQSVADYFILHDYLKEIDIFWDSTRFYIKQEAYVNEKGETVVSSRLHGGPAWDFDYSMFWDHIDGGGQGEHDAYKNGKCEGGVAGDPTTGVWASVEWGQGVYADNPYRLWFCPLYMYCPEFVKIVCETVADFNDEMTLMYQDKTDDKGNVITQNIIDTFIADENISKSIDPNDSKADTYKNLREWLRKRNEWMQKFYAEKLVSLNK